MTNSLPTVDFVIPTEDVQTVVALLLSNQISFTLTSSTYVEKAAIATEQIEKTKMTNGRPLIEANPKNVAIENIYQKYLVEKIEQIPPTASEIAAEFGMTLSLFRNQFKEIYGGSFYQVYLDKKMEYAAQLLQKGYRATKVSAMVGYGEKSCIKFNKMFQKHFGVTPKKYQTNQLKRFNTNA
jgi:AraC-like DNA-binding protein